MAKYKVRPKRLLVLISVALSPLVLWALGYGVFRWDAFYTVFLSLLSREGVGHYFLGGFFLLMLMLIAGAGIIIGMLYYLMRSLIGWTFSQNGGNR